MTARICLLVGDCTTQYCGVKDYALRLDRALNDIGISSEVAAPRDWGITSFLSFREKVRREHFDILHLQYPSIGHRSSLFPHSLGWMGVARRSVVTLHEYSALPLAQRLSTHIFRFTSDQLIFSVNRESVRFGSCWTPKRIIPIGSNVPAAPARADRTMEVLYFGQIRPNKGLEDFLLLATRSRQLQKPFKFHIAGSVAPRRLDYYTALRAQASPDIVWSIDLSFDQVAELMVNAFAAYLPYPDGATYRRGSLLAAFTNGLVPVTTVCSETPNEMREIVLHAGNPAEALAQLEKLMSNPQYAERLSHGGRTFAQRFSWMQIAREHEVVYSEALKKTGSLDQRSLAARTLREP